LQGSVARRWKRAKNWKARERERERERGGRKGRNTWSLVVRGGWKGGGKGRGSEWERGRGRGESLKGGRTGWFFDAWISSEDVVL